MIADGDVAHGNPDQTGDQGVGMGCGIARGKPGVFPNEGPKHLEVPGNPVFLHEFGYVGPRYPICHEDKAKTLGVLDPVSDERHRRVAQFIIGRLRLIAVSTRSMTASSTWRHRVRKMSGLPEKCAKSVAGEQSTLRDSRRMDTASLLSCR